jgi:hypothetical protein
MTPKKISTMFSHDPLVGVKCIVIRGLRASQACTLGYVRIAYLSTTRCSFTR